MLKANSKKARENLMKYIEEYTADKVEEYEELENMSNAAAVYEIFKIEKQPNCPYYKRFPESKVFEDWAQGLAMNGLFLYYYNRSAVDDLGAILEETEEEKARYTEEQAAQFLTNLIYNRVKSEAEKEELERR